MEGWMNGWFADWILKTLKKGSMNEFLRNEKNFDIKKKKRKKDELRRRLKMRDEVMGGKVDN